MLKGYTINQKILEYLKKVNGNIDDRKIKYNNCIEIINKLRFKEENLLFAVERDKGLESIIGNIY